MTDARLRRRWHRSGILLAFGALALAGAAQGCSSDDGAGPSFNLGAESPSAFDATPDPDGETLFFTGLTADGDVGVFKAPADGSKTAPETVTKGGLLTAPFGITISSDGETLFIADSGANMANLDTEDGAVQENRGAILTLPTKGGEAAVLAGTEDSTPHSLEIGKDSDGNDVIFFTGTNKADGLPAVFSIPVKGGKVTTVLKGDPLRDPSGIAVAADGTLYVADTISGSDRGADIIKISDGKGEAILSGIRVGYPCGIALDTTDSVLFVSALDTEEKTDIVIKFELATKTQTVIAPDTINKFTESAGLHRARNQDVFGWADSKGGKAGGSVFLVK